MGELIPFRPRRRRPALPARRARHGGGAAFSARQLRLALWSGLLLGLLLFQAMRYWPAPAAPDANWSPAAVLEADEPGLPAAAVDPYAESRRSRALLEAQEGAPPPALGTSERRPLRAAGDGGGGVRVRAGGVRVIDGDTFVHAGVRIRVADIDTPEVRGRCPYETALAARATARMRQLVTQGDFQLHPLPSGRDEDRYGRKLRIVTRGGRSLGDVLVAEGLARTWSGRREPWCG